MLNHTMPNRYIFRRYWLYGPIRCLYESCQAKIWNFWSAKGALKDLKVEIAYIAQVVDLTDHHYGIC